MRLLGTSSSFKEMDSDMGPAILRLCFVLQQHRPWKDFYVYLITLHTVKSILTMLVKELPLRDVFSPGGPGLTI